jgi:hypothetical protein
MLADDEMTINERRKYLKKMRPRYQQANRAERSQLLTEMEHITGMHRKSLIRLLTMTSLERRKRTTSRQRSYGLEVEQVVTHVWESLDDLCAERLTPALLPTAHHLARFGELHLSPHLEAQLATISRATVQRMLSTFRRFAPRLPRKGPEQANHLRKAVPMERLSWQIELPGSFEVDLVHHSGDCSAGEYVHTLQMIDIATGWSERVAVFGRSQRAMEAGFRRMLARLPFPVRHVHPDNGAEFFNNHLVRFWGEEITGLRLSRSRPYHKNDNRFVEQKNDTLVRAFLGPLRLDTPQQAAALDALYDQMWLYYNFFQPVLHLVEKVVQDGKLKRRWDTAATPYQRLVGTGILDKEGQCQLDHLYTQTNPRQLRTQIYQQLDTLWKDSVLQAQAAA